MGGSPLPPRRPAGSPWRVAAGLPRTKRGRRVPPDGGRCRAGPEEEAAGCDPPCAPPRRTARLAALEARSAAGTVVRAFPGQAGAVVCFFLVGSPVLSCRCCPGRFSRRPACACAEDSGARPFAPGRFRLAAALLSCRVHKAVLLLKSCGVKQRINSSALPAVIL